MVLWPGAFNGLGKLEILDLAQNKLTMIAGFPVDILEPLESLQHLYLNKSYIQNLRGKLSKPLLSLRVWDLSDNGCEMVERTFSESFPSLEILRLEGNELGKTMLKAGSGKSLFSGLTRLEQLYISSNNIRNLPDLIFPDQIILKVLDISKNQISGWGPSTFKFTSIIEKIDISLNSLSVLRENNLHDLDSLKELNLTANKFICDCELLWFREWIDSTSVALPGKEFYLCDGPDEWRGKHLLEFNKDKITCTAIPAIVGTLAGAIVITALLGVIVYRNRWRLRLRMYLLSKRGRNFLRDMRGHAQHQNYGAINDDDRREYYDAYVSCSDHDYDWVLHHLLPGIDNDRYDGNMFGGEFKLYYDPRDQEPGTMAIANIFEHMTRSRKVIVVLTTDYLKDGMNIFELDQTTTLYHDQELDDIIVIKVGDVPARRVPAHLYTQMRTGRFLEWEQDVHAIEQFKEKLKDRLRGDRVDLC